MTNGQGWERVFCTGCGADVRVYPIDPATFPCPKCGRLMTPVRLLKPC